MVIRQLYLSLSVALLSSCALIIDPLENNLPPIQKIEKPTIGSLLVPGLANIKAGNKVKPVVAIYGGSFTDQTGQRRSNSAYATFSSAVTQAPDAYLIRALKHAGSNKDGFFDVVERVGLDHVTKERQIIRSARQKNKDRNYQIYYSLV